MKTHHYVKKYRLDLDDKFNHKEFITDFKADFHDMLKKANINGDYSRFKRLVEDVKQKWMNINKKTVGQLPESLWDYFYASTIVECRDELFPQFAKKKVEAETNH
mgnify:CR=1 FL=1